MPCSLVAHDATPLAWRHQKAAEAAWHEWAEEVRITRNLRNPWQELATRTCVQYRTEGCWAYACETTKVDEPHTREDAFERGLLELFPNLTVSMRSSGEARLTSNATQDDHVSVVQVLELSRRRCQHMHSEQQARQQKSSGEYELVLDAHVSGAEDLVRQRGISLHRRRRTVSDVVHVACDEGSVGAQVLVIETTRIFTSLPGTARWMCPSGPRRASRRAFADLPRYRSKASLLPGLALRRR